MRLVWILLLIGFAALNIYAVVAGGLSGLMGFLGNLGPWGTLAVVDLLIALTVALAFIWQDARSRAVNPLPYVALTLLTGSIGVLVYLVRYWNGGSRPSRKTALERT